MLLLAVADRAPGQSDDPAERTRPAVPNIVLIVADDLGWADLGFRGGDVTTPSIDRLAREGLVLERLYAHPVCAATRASLMTGRMVESMNVIGNLRRAGDLPITERLMPALFGSAGYQTWLVGKWHLGGLENERQLPHRRGFDHFYGFLGGAIDSFTHESRQSGVIDWQRNGRTIDEDGYSTDLLCDEAIRLIDRREGSRPFLLVLSFNAVHRPYQAPMELRTKYSHVQPAQRRAYLAMLEAMDGAIGRVMAALDDRDLRRDTLVLFLNDNGGRPPLADNGPLRGGKGDIFEGGVRVGGIIRWPHGLSAKGVSHQLCTVMDVLPTLADAAELELPGDLELDGRSVWPQLQQGSTAPRPGVVVGHNRRYAVFEYPWKLVRHRGQGLGLYNLETDPQEVTDLAEQHPEIVKRLRLHLRAVRSAVEQ